MIGKTLGRYRVIEQIAAGGMGVVYRAHDTRLDRDVALKMLSPGLFADQRVRERFRQEALALSRLNHPHICSIYDFDTEGSDEYLVMELVHGETLASRISRSALREEEILSLGQQVADALAAAHKQGVIHRDLKPGNVMVDENGQVKVLDFGLARRLTAPDAETMVQNLTATGTFIGTPSYMAPEQLVGKEPDARTDVYSMGVVLYEMATGEAPFRQTVPGALVDAILHQEVPRPRGKVLVSSALESLILHCLEKEPKDRPQGAAEVALSLAAIERGERGTHRRRRPRFGRVLALAAGLAIALGMGTYSLVLWNRIDSLAVLPFLGPRGDTELTDLRDGLSEALIDRLSAVTNLRVIASASVSRFKDKPDLDLGSVARQLHARALVTGRIVRRGSELIARVEMVDSRNNRHLWGGDFAPEGGNWGSVEQQIASAIAGRLSGRLTAIEAARLNVRPTTSGNAYRLYLRGRSALSRYNEEGTNEALSLFQQAAEADPEYSLAYSGIAECYYQASNLWRAPREAMPRARAAAMRALQLDSLSAEAHTALAYIEAQYDWNWAEAEREYKRALALGPSLPQAHYGYATLLTALGRNREARIEFLKARDLDPLSPIHGVRASMVLTNSGHTQDAIVELKRILRTEPEFAPGWAQLSIDQMIEGDCEEAHRSMTRAFELQPEDVSLRAGIGVNAARCGNVALARQILAELKTTVESQSTGGIAMVQYQMAKIASELGDMNAALAWLDIAYDGRCEDLVLFKVDPLTRKLRADPRGQQFLRRMHLDG